MKLLSDRQAVVILLMLWAVIWWLVLVAPGNGLRSGASELSPRRVPSVKQSNATSATFGGFLAAPRELGHQGESPR